MIPVKMGKDDDFDFIQSDAQTLKLFVNGLPRVLAPLMMVFLGSFGIAHAGVHQYFAPVAFNQKSKYGVFDNFVYVIMVPFSPFLPYIFRLLFKRIHRPDSTRGFSKD
jgi:hypothetical protein